jgi:alkaline phosphatase
MHTRTRLALASAVALALASTVAQADPGRTRTTRLFPTGNVIFIHPDGAGQNHYNAARIFFRGPDASMNYDRLPFMAAYRGHMQNRLNGTSHGGATTHAFGYKVDGFGSFGRDGDGAAARQILGLSGHPGSILREAAAAGLPVGVVNDGHIGEPGTGAFLAEVGNRNEWGEITRQMIQGRPGMNDPTPWVMMGGGEADTRPRGTALVHRNHNQERTQPLDAQVSLRTDDLDLEADWDDNGANLAPGLPLADKLAARDDFLVLKTRADLEALSATLAADVNYAPRVLGLFAYQDLMNDRNEEDLIARGKRLTTPECGTTAAPIRFVGPAPTRQSCLVLFGEADATQPGFNPPTFAEMTEVAITILDRAARQQANSNARRFLLVAEPESVDNFGNSGNSVGMLHALRDADDAIGVAHDYVRRNPRTLVITAADSEAMTLTVTNVAAGAADVVACGSTPANVGTQGINPATGLPAVAGPIDGVEGRATPAFVSAPDQFGQCQLFGLSAPGSSDYFGGILSRGAGLNAGLLNTVFSERFDNVDVYRMMYTTLFGRLLNYPTGQLAPARP